MSFPKATESVTEKKLALILCMTIAVIAFIFMISFNSITEYTTLNKLHYMCLTGAFFAVFLAGAVYFRITIYNIMNR